MRLLAPANPKEIDDRKRWFLAPEAVKLSKTRGVKFGIEMKGPLENIRQAPDLFWGLHLPDMLATEWYYHPERREALKKELKRVAKLKPDYTVLHGIHLLWQPPARNYIERYQDYSSSEEYFKILEANIEIIKFLQPLFNLKLENFPLYFYYLEGKKFLPYTFLCSGVGRLDDLVYLKKKTRVDIMFDTEHMEIVLNFLSRKKNYRRLPVEKIDNLTADEKRLKEIFGYYLKKGYIPYLDREVSLEEMIKKIKPRFFHLTGSTQDVIAGKKIATHLPIKIDDQNFRRNLRLVLAQKPEVILVETASSGYNSAWDHLRPNETELSFYNLCKILSKEL